MIKPVIIIAQLFIAFNIILISYTAFNWTCVMENGDLDITFHMESFFLACSVYCFAHMETSP